MDERRTSRRIPITIRAPLASVFFSNGEGRIIDLAIGGCRIETLMHVSLHTYLELRLHVSRTDIPIVVDLAAVRWVRDGHLGVEFLSMSPEHRTRLQQVIEQAPDLEGTNHSWSTACGQ